MVVFALRVSHFSLIDCELPERSLHAEDVVESLWLSRSLALVRLEVALLLQPGLPGFQHRHGVIDVFLDLAVRATILLRQDVLSKGLVDGGHVVRVVKVDTILHFLYHEGLHGRYDLFHYRRHVEQMQRLRPHRVGRLQDGHYFFHQSGLVEGGVVDVHAGGVLEQGEPGDAALLQHVQDDLGDEEVNAELVVHVLLFRIDFPSSDQKYPSAVFIVAFDVDVSTVKSQLPVVLNKFFLVQQLFLNVSIPLFHHLDCLVYLVHVVEEVRARGPDRVEEIQLFLGLLNAVLASSQENRDVPVVCTKI